MKVGIRGEITEHYFTELCLNTLNQNSDILTFQFLETYSKGGQPRMENNRIDRFVRKYILI